MKHHSVAFVSLSGSVRTSSTGLTVQLPQNDILSPIEALSSTLLLNQDPSVVSSPETTFEPVLNVPAFASFLVIAAIFTFLQIRVRSIEQAAIERTKALEKLRHVKRRELQEKSNEQEVSEALENYRQAVLKVERLRQVIPGVNARIIQPPSQSVTRERMDENVAAAKQFLDMDLEQPAENSNKEMSLGLKILIAVVAIFQIGILVLLSVDPMTANNSW